MLRGHGFKTVIEKSIGQGKTVDLVASKKESKIAVEVETGTRGIINIEKLLDADFDWIMSFHVNSHLEAYTKMRLTKQPYHLNHLIFVTPATLEKRIKEL